MNPHIVTATFLVLSAACMASGAESDGDAVPLEGQFLLGSATPVDAPENEPRNTHGYFSITGEAARVMFDALPGSAEYDECLDDGSVSKTGLNQTATGTEGQGRLSCTRVANGESYECYFSVDLVNQRLGQVGVC